MSILKMVMTLGIALAAFVSDKSNELVQLGKQAPVQAELPPGGDDGGTAGGC